MKRIVVVLSMTLGCYLYGAEPSVLEGDIIFQDSVSAQSKAVKIATSSRFSHVGIIIVEKGRAYVLEAVQPVTVTPLQKWIARGQNNYYEIKRLKNRDRLLNKSSLSAMRSVGMKMKGKNYDSYFGWDDSRIYCSELVWKIYKRGAGIELAQPKKIREYNLSDPTVQRIMKQRYGSKIPYDEPAVSPEDIYRSELLEPVK